MCRALLPSVSHEDARRERMNALVLANRHGGPDRVLHLVEERAPNGFTRIEDVMTIDELDSIALQYRTTAGFEADSTLNHHGKSANGLSGSSRLRSLRSDQLCFWLACRRRPGVS